MDTPVIPKTRPQRQSDNVLPSVESNKAQLPSIPLHRPHKSSTELPVIPKTRPKKVQTTDSTPPSPSPSPSPSPIVATVPIKRPSSSLDIQSEVCETTSESVAPSIPSSRPARTIHTANIKTSLNSTETPVVPLSRPKNIVNSEIEEEIVKEEETTCEKETVEEEKTNEEEYVNKEEEDVNEEDEDVNEEGDVNQQGTVNEEASNIKEINQTSKNEKSDANEDFTDNNKVVDKQFIGLKTQEHSVVEDNDSFAEKENNSDTKNNSSRKTSHSSAKKVLDDLEVIEHEIEDTTQKISSLPTDDIEIDEPVNDVKPEEIENDEGKDISDEANKKLPKEEEKQEEVICESALPVIPKSRPRAKIMEDVSSAESLVDDVKEKEKEKEKHRHAPPKVPTKRPSITNTETVVNSSTESIHKKVPPRVPKKPSSRIAQFQEMLQQQQQADLGVLDTPKPKPKTPIKHYEISTDDVIEGNGGNTNEDKDTSSDDNPKPVQKVNSIHSKFAQSLNGMIGVGLPGMAFGGDPFAAIKAAKESQNQNEKEADKHKAEGDSEKSKVNDIRSRRARGPRGRKLPDSVLKVVEVNDSTLGNTLSIVVKNLWSFDFNEVNDAKLEENIEDEYINDNAKDNTEENRVESYIVSDSAVENRYIPAASNETSNATTNETSNETSNEISNETTGTSNETTNETSKETTNETTNEELTETPSVDEVENVEIPLTTFSTSPDESEITETTEKQTSEAMEKTNEISDIDLVKSDDQVEKKINSVSIDHQSYDNDE